MYGVNNPLDRAAFFDDGAAVTIADEARAHQLLRDRSFDLRTRLVLPPHAVNRPANATTRPTSPPLKLQIQRPSPDTIIIPLTGRTGWVRVLEAFDRGWRARIDGKDAPIYPAHEMAMAMQVPAGSRELRLDFSTPGAEVGQVISIAAVIGIGVISWLLSSRPNHVSISSNWHS
jgi:hypothetical protein